MKKSQAFHRIAISHNELVPVILPGHIVEAKAGIRMSEGPLNHHRCLRRLAMGHIGMKYSLAAELIADSVETPRVASFDGLVLFPTATRSFLMLMVALGLNIPA
jgi:dihydroxyacid dehydratase/phosphogluconate dehydratase